MQISSPRAPRSSHHRSPSTRTSPRHDRARPFSGGHRIDQPNFEGTSPIHPPENLRDADQTFNVDPAAGLLEAALGETQEPVAPASRRRLVNGFVGGLRRAWGRNRGPGEEEVAFPEPVLVNEEEREYEPVPRADPEIIVDPRYTSPTPDARYMLSSPQPDEHYAASPKPQSHYATSQDAHYPRTEDHHRQESSTTVSETVHTTQEHYEGTTMVGHHEMIVVPAGGVYTSPQLVEPELASDYAKMDSPPRSEASLGSYISRLHNFFKVVNALPWIAEDRVTVDYYPGRRSRISRDTDYGASIRDSVFGEMPMPTPRPRPRSSAPRRSVKSWYNSNQPHDPIDLLEGSSSPSARSNELSPPPPVPPVPRSLVGTMYTAGGETPAMYTATTPVMVTTTSDMASVPPSTRPSRSHRVPPPRFDPELEEEENGAYYEPKYPNGGYVPYDQQPVAPTYTGSSFGGSTGRSTRR